MCLTHVYFEIKNCIIPKSRSVATKRNTTVHEPQIITDAAKHKKTAACGFKSLKNKNNTGNVANNPPLAVIIEVKPPNIPIATSKKRSDDFTNKFS